MNFLHSRIIHLTSDLEIEIMTKANRAVNVDHVNDVFLDFAFTQMTLECWKH